MDPADLWLGGTPPPGLSFAGLVLFVIAVVLGPWLWLRVGRLPATLPAPRLTADWSIGMLPIWAVLFSLMVWPSLLPAVAAASILLLLHQSSVSPVQLWRWPRSFFAWVYSLRHGVMLYPMIIGPLFIVMLGTDLLAQSLGIPQQPQLAVELFLRAEGWQQMLSLLLLAVVVAPVWEEMFFRGYLYPWLAARISPRFANVFTSLMFAALHGHWISFPALALLGGFLAWWMEKTGRLSDCILLHAVFNGVTCSLLLLYKFNI